MGARKGQRMGHSILCDMLSKQWWKAHDSHVSRSRTQVTPFLSTPCF